MTVNENLKIVKHRKMKSLMQNYCSHSLYLYFLLVIVQVDYFVDCHYSSTEDRLWLIGGTSSGTLGYFPITQKCNGTTIGAVEAILEGGHMGVVRSILPANADQTSRYKMRMVFFFF